MDDVKFPEGLPRFQFTAGELVPGRVELVPGEPLATERTALAILEELRAIRARLVPPPEPVRGGGPGCVGPYVAPTFLAHPPLLCFSSEGLETACAACPRRVAPGPAEAPTACSSPSASAD